MLKEQNTYMQENKSSRRDKTIQRTSSILKPIMKQTPQQIIQKVSKNPDSLTHADAIVLQRTIGNRAVIELLSKSYSEQIDKPAQLKAGEAKNSKPENKTGLPNNLKVGIENMSGLSMDDVKVHYNSDKPSKLGALAYTQGTNIHVASGQEKHLPHEAWHVVQQKQGRVQPTIQAEGKNVNDDARLEKEADVMGESSFQNKVADNKLLQAKKIYKTHSSSIFQLSRIGKAGTILGVGIFAGTTALLGPAILGAGVVSSAIIGGALYMGHKELMGGLFIGGDRNLDILENGKRQRQAGNRVGSIGIGLINKKHLFSHVIIVINGRAFEQTIAGQVGEKKLIKSIAKPLNGDDAQTEFGSFDDFDAGRGRLVSIDVEEGVSAKALTEVNRKCRVDMGSYRLLANSCASNVADVLKYAGLKPPQSGITPYALWLWMKGLSEIQRKLM